MKRFVRVLLAVGILCVPCHGFAMSQDAFDRKAIPMLDKPAQASKLLALCEEALKNISDKDFETYVRVVKSHGHLMNKEYDKAEEEAQKAIDSGLQPDLAYTAMMEVFFNRGKYEEGNKKCLEYATTIDNKKRRADMEQECEAIYAHQKAITADTLWTAYKKDAKDAAARYGSGSVTVTGMVVKTETTSEGTRVFLSVDKSSSKQVVCLFPAEKKAASASKDTASKIGESKAKDTKSEEPKAESPTADAPQSEKEMSYSLSDSEESVKETKSSEKKEAEKPSTDTAAQETPAMSSKIPPKGEEARISGTVRGLEGDRLILEDCILSGR